MGLLNLIANIWTPSNREEALDRVVRRTTPAILAAVGNTPLAMCTAEARGYIRAKAISETRHQVSVVLEEFPRLEHQRETLVRSSLDQVTRVVLSQLRDQIRGRFQLKKVA